MNGQEAVALAQDIFLDEEHLYGCAETTFIVLTQAYGLQSAGDARAAMVLNGGVALNGCICGALSGGAMALGMLAGERIADHRQAKYTARALMNRVVDVFKAQFGSLDCRDLIEMDIRDPQQHEAFLKGDIWRQRCMRQIALVVEHLALLADPLEWDKVVDEVALLP